MTEDRVPVHMLVRTRTLLVTVIGFAGAAFVTSFAAVTGQAGAIEAAVRAALAGGVALLVLCAAVAGHAALRLPGARERRLWGAVFAAELLVAGGSLLRAGSFLYARSELSGRAGEGVYTAGLLILMGTAVVLPTRHAGPAKLAGPLAASLVVAAALGAVFWVLAGSGMAQAVNARDTSMGPGRLLGFMALMLLLAAVVVFSALGALVTRSSADAVPLLFLSAGLASVLAGDLSWLYRMSHACWVPGTFGDFVHLAGHVLVATAALVAADIAAAEPLTR